MALLHMTGFPLSHRYPHGRWRRWAAWYVLSGFFCCLSIAHAQTAVETELDQALHEQVLDIPGDPVRPVMLQVTMFKPDGPGPFPLAVINHGKDRGDPRMQPRYRSAYIARYFVSRGYAVVLPMLRGFAGSGGTFSYQGCDAEGEGLSQARDILSVIAYMTRQPEIDAGRIVVAGQSYGGWNTLALGSLNVNGVRALVNFSGGRNAAFCPAWPSDLATGARHYGQRTRVPSLWLYGDNDRWFPAATWREMYRQYRDAGGPAELVAYGRFHNDAHELIGSIEALPLWVPRIDAFLTRAGLPGREVQAGVLPMLYPAATGFANIDAIDAIPFLNEPGRKAYAAFLALKIPRVFVIAADGLSVTSQGGLDPLARALELCRKNSHDCRAYAINEQVVWSENAALLSGSKPREEALSSEVIHAHD
ncbi:CocE/NonD family hydrolase [Herbaspirillum sp. RTI4]|uniref:alpha/beta hydrolase family protein n=1 Tax=Herbaspirillum sp. RTI4 TaxID=3048640 RepID=UPI002AB4FBB2|nr:CocE/NonD family hydrolase [Herbaspirillum sp. RTI4]MDY7578643.1 CocE/NonD family hydrolase [Herbaspirillum sp. RTI4]MEA9980659.1 CocE/NonD family hydrolase [Herbaspirillum sp. RTI4]